MSDATDQIRNAEKEFIDKGGESMSHKDKTTLLLKIAAKYNLGFKGFRYLEKRLIQL